MIRFFAQIIGFLAVVLYLLSYQLKKRKHIVCVTCVSNALYVSQYILLGAFSGAVMDFISTISSFFAVKKNNDILKKNIKLISVLNMIIIVIAGLIITILRDDLLELLPIVGTLFTTIGLWCDNEQNIRKFGLIGTPFWFIYNIASTAYGAAFGSALVIISLIIALLRYRKKYTI